MYGVLSSIASQYRREIGVRLALGARWSDIVRLLLARGLAVAAAGIAIGLVGVAGGARLLRGFLFSVAPTDPVALGSAAALMWWSPGLPATCRHGGRRRPTRSRCSERSRTGVPR